MYCPKCEQECQVQIKTKVIESRLQSNLIVRRRRYCPNCKGRFTTWESPMSMDSRETLLKKPQRKLNKIKQLAQEIVDGINENK